MTACWASIGLSLQHVVLLSFPTDLSDAEDAQLCATVHSWPREMATMSEARQRLAFDYYVDATTDAFAPS